MSPFFYGYNDRAPGLPRYLPSILCALAFVPMSGCAPRSTQIRIQDFAHPDGPRSLHQDFNETYFQLDAAGSLELILRRSSPSEAIPTESITQTILVTSYWRPVPGQTAAESSMINAKITYVIESGRAVRVYEGMGFVSFAEHRKGELLSGRVEAATLRPTGEIGNPPHPFGKALIEGTFRATNKPRRATQILTDIKHLQQEMRPVDE